MRRPILLLPALLLWCGTTYAGPVDMIKLSGITGGIPAETIVYRGELTTQTPSFVTSITIQDASFGFGGAPGRFSGFDLDAVKLAYESAETAAAAVGLPMIPVFDLSSSGTLFSPGVMRPPFDPTLFGTDSTGTAPNFSVATLGAFDANSTISLSGALGFLSLGDGGSITFNLTRPVLSTDLFLYVGEVEDEGEDLTVTVNTASVPEPSGLTLFGTGALVLIACGHLRRRRTIP